MHKALPYFGKRLAPHYYIETIQSPDCIQIKARSLVSFIFFGFFFFCVVIRLVSIMLLNNQSMSDSLVLPSSLIERGNIYDRNGEVLATSLVTGSAYANPQEILDVKETVEKLTSIFPDLKSKELFKKLSSKKGFVWIKRYLTPKAQNKLNYLGLPGIYFQREERRVYPHKNLTSHIVGFTGTDNIGLSGIEKQFDSMLKKDQQDINLSIDVRVQHVLHDELQKGMAQFKAKAGSALMLDAKTSEVVAMVSLPDYDPNHPNKINKETSFNASTLGIYEMGSILKIFTVASALDSGKIKLTNGYDATEDFKVGRHKITDFHKKKRWLSVPEILMYSSNIGVAKMALELGGVKQKAFMEKMGLLKPMNLEIPENGRPLSPKSWQDITTATVSYGYGLAISPLQLANGIGAIVNGGVLNRPTILKEGNKDFPQRRVISSGTSDKMRKLLHLVVKKGTGKKSDVNGYVVGGKTGSANKKEGKGYVKKGKHRALYAGAFPMYDPRYVILVILDEPQGTKETFGFSTGGWTSAPIAKEIITKTAPILGVLPVDEKSPKIKSAMHININSRKDAPHAIG